MQFLTNEENLVPLRNALETAEKRIWISSAWIRSATLSKVFTPQVIETSIEMVTEAQLDEIPAYEQGQCLITGVGVKEPVTVKIG